MNIYKLKGFASPYMLGAVIGLGIISTSIGYKAQQQNNKYEQKYIQQKKEYIQNLAKSLDYTVSTENNYNNGSGADRLKKYAFSNAFDVNTDLKARKRGEKSKKLTAISLDNNAKKHKRNSVIATNKMLKTDFSNESSMVYSEDSIRKEQILKSYANMKKQAEKMYSDIIASKNYVWPDSVTLYVKDSWNRDFTYTKVDDQNAQLAFNLPWNTATKKILPVRLPAIPAEPFPKVEYAKLLASDPWADDYFGASVSINGDLILIGASQDNDKGSSSGSAYIFRKNGSTWLQEAKLLASDGYRNDRFGNSVLIRGDTAMVGAYHDRNENGSLAGSVYIFKKNGELWEEKAKLVGSSSGYHDYFATSMSISGNLLLVGSPGDNDNASDSGSAHIFRKEGENWVREAKLLPSDSAADDFFGSSVSISGDLAIIGAYKNDDKGSNSGSAYIFRREGVSWVEEAKLLASDGEAENIFGSSVSISGNLAIIGAYKDNDNGLKSGSAYIFRRDGTSWVEDTKIIAPDGESNDYFGSEVVIEDDLVAIGAHKHNDSGSVYIYKKEGDTWVKKIKLFASDGEKYDNFGSQISISEGSLVVGVLGDDDNNASNSGSAYVYVSK